MRLRALRFLLSAAFALLGASAFAAAYAVETLRGPVWLLAQWPAYARSRAAAEPEREEPWLRHLVNLSPRDSDARIRLALIAEWRGDLAGARAGLAQVAAFDARYRAQWSRLEFEARHPGHVPWQTVRRCFAMSYGDRRALLETVWALRPDGHFLVTELLPDNPPVLFHATTFLMDQNDLPSARAAFARLLALPLTSESRANAGLVATATERMRLGLALTDLHLDRDNAPASIALWQSLVAKQLLRVDGGRQVGAVMNPRFRTEPLGLGFDWRLAPAPSLDMRRAEEGWRVDLPLHPPDHLPLLHQRVLLAPGALPGIRVASNAPAWVRARLLDERSGQELAGPLLRARVARLSLEYWQPPGQPPLRQPLVIHQVQWSPR